MPLRRYNRCCYCANLQSKSKLILSGETGELYALPHLTDALGGGNYFCQQRFIIASVNDVHAVLRLAMLALCLSLAEALPPHQRLPTVELHTPTLIRFCLQALRSKFTNQAEVEPPSDPSKA
ncbi:hypothetical protein NDU88_003319 [Pleurodeles waltl]|uniref:Uncharacterized protein n=1 Tax=Pleurodeles waltl TaxID=8319 RepID=A0AAV7LI86_PLEWA|nr:hypothetical protein NDU88_003319 [Pleurodeles waltl]